MYGKQTFASKVEVISSFIDSLLIAVPVQWAAAQLTLSTPRTTLGTVIKQIQSQSKYQFSTMTSYQLYTVGPFKSKRCFFRASFKHTFEK